ncbi:hypothetical protein NDU88_005105 [Pleurodeles waltl]|uniref:Uncharacterized protein n=1 Tax=Pleurodeles waltl TaxID=8319 RepID=A0AAV7QI06_PLEWA|nr:hypothetical protein NDU88_005105 [Pleurodeles waltl]
MLNVRFLANVTEAEHHDASVSKETETLARSSREVLRTLRNTEDFGLVQRILYIKVSPYKGEGKKSMIGTKWFVDDEVSNDMSSQCEFGVPVRHANETQVVGGNGVPMQSDESRLSLCDATLDEPVNRNWKWKGYDPPDTRTQTSSAVDVCGPPSVLPWPQPSNEPLFLYAQ